MNEYDAAVIGAGPAGCTAARLLALWGYAVVLVARPATAHERAETLPPSCRRLFRFLDVDRQIASAGFYPTAGNTAWWGSDEARVENYPAEIGCGYQVLRRDFDALLLGLAQPASIVNDAVRSADPTSGTVLLRSGGELRARFILDASGRAGVVARSGFRKHDPVSRMIAICGMFEASRVPKQRDKGVARRPGDLPYKEAGAVRGHTLIESYRDGWVWSVPVSETRAFVTVMVDPRVTRMSRGDGLEATYARELEKTRHIRPGPPTGAVWACDASVYHATTYAGPRFLLIGDAGSSVDPLSSYGVKKAMTSAWLAATVVNTCLRDSSRSSVALDYFNTQEQQVFTDHMRQTAAHYRAVATVENHPFWLRRSETPAHTAFYTEPELTAALDTIRRAPAIRLRRSSGVQPQAVPRISGREIVLGEGLLAPGIPRAIEYLEGVHLWKLAEMAESYSQVPDLYAAYNRSCQPVPLPNFLSALSVLVAKNVLMNEVRA